jgi:hypothetical protein
LANDSCLVWLLKISTEMEDKTMKRQVWLLLVVSILLLLVEFTTNTQAQISSFTAPCDLPSKFEAYEVRNMIIGGVGYASPKALMVDENGKCWLWAKTELVSNKKLGSGWIRIEKHPEGFFVYVGTGIDKPITWVRDHIPYQTDRIKDQLILPVTMVVGENFLH